MAIWDSVKGQLRSVIQWDDANQNELFHLWSENGDEIKNCSKLIVKPGQGAIFVYEGKVQAMHNDEGLFELKTANIPFFTTLFKFMQAFQSEHKVGIYFYWRTEFLNQKWGTVSPIKYNDPVYKFPVGLRAFGNFSFHITKADQFFVNVVGAQPSYPLDALRRVIAERFQQPLVDLLAGAGLSYAEIDKHRVELGTNLRQQIAPEFDKLGFELTDFRLESTDFDEETKARINKIADTMADAQAAQAAGLNYAQMQQLQALRDAAKNEGGIAGAGIGLGAGLGLGQMFAAGMAGMPAKAAEGSVSPTERLKQLQDLFDQKLISQEEFNTKRAEILSKI